LKSGGTPSAFGDARGNAGGAADGVPDSGELDGRGCASGSQIGRPMPKRRRWTIVTPTLAVNQGLPERETAAGSLIAAFRRKPRAVGLTLQRHQLGNGEAVIHHRQPDHQGQPEPKLFSATGKWTGGCTATAKR